LNGYQKVDELPEKSINSNIAKGLNWTELISKAEVEDNWVFDRIEGESMTDLSVVLRSKQKREFERVSLPKLFVDSVYASYGSPKTFD